MMKGHLENVAKRVFPDFLKLVNEVDVKEGDEKLPVFLVSGRLRAKILNEKDLMDLTSPSQLI